MARLRISMRWWLAFAFAVIAAVTAVVVAQVFSQRSQGAFRERAEDLAVGSSVAASEILADAYRGGTLDQAAQATANRRQLALFVFAPDGTLLASARPRDLDRLVVPQQSEARESALAGKRFIATDEEGKGIVVGLPVLVPAERVPGAESLAVVAYAPRPGLAVELGIVRENIIEAALIAVAVGALVGLLVAALITARLRRIAATAAAIEAGSFDRSLRPRFRDELGALALTIDRMRERLRASFQRLESERDRLSRLLERLQDGVVTVRRDLEVEFANESAGRLLGQRTLSEGDPLPDPWPEFSLRRLASGLFADDAVVAQARVAPSDDRTYVIAGIPAGKETETAVLVITDVSERERRERAERDFVTNAAHELRTPLAAITGAVEVLQSGAKELPEERDRFIEHIERETQRLGRLTRALLVLARAQTREEAPRLAPVDLDPLLREIAGGLHPATGVDLEVHCPPGIQALADRDLMEQALANLAANAAKNTIKGRILLAARPLPGGTVRIDVTDTGPGMSTEAQERIFDRFYRTGSRDADGFGLGLSIVRQAVRALGGRIEVDSVPGRGTTVSVLLPAAQERAA